MDISTKVSLLNRQLSPQLNHQNITENSFSKEPKDKFSSLQDDIVTITGSGAHPTRPKKLEFLQYDLATIRGSGAHPTRPKK